MFFPPSDSLAQLGEHPTSKRKVPGSIPGWSVIFVTVFNLICDVIRMYLLYWLVTVLTLYYVHIVCNLFQCINSDNSRCKDPLKKWTSVTVSIFHYFRFSIDMLPFWSMVIKKLEWLFLLVALGTKVNLIHTCPIEWL